ncbi:hypothetical protein BC828DRAFT_415521 [Blastocladiella britannica]|nr:hypothetical protein BC828DRAFT_415521 [Blastocladiella britannica]
MPEPALEPAVLSDENARLLERMKQHYYTPTEVALHDKKDDLWVSWLGSVYNLTPLIAQYYGDPRLAPIVKNAGRDISHWFDASTGTLQTHMDPRTGMRLPLCPDGVPVHLADATQVHSERALEAEIPWWMDHLKYRIGRLSAKTRHVRIVNTLTGHEMLLEICTEEPIQAILNRYIVYNAHASGYVWKFLGRVLDMSQTLAENGIPDESDTMAHVGITEKDWLPALFLYYADDLTVA